MTETSTRQLGLVAYRAATDLAAKAALFAVTIVAARQLTGDAFGLFSLATTIGWIVAVLGDFGIQVHLSRAVAQQPARASALLHHWTSVRVGTALLGVGLVAVAAPWLAHSWSVGGVLLLFALVYAVNGLIEFLFYFFRALGRTDLESGLVLAQRLVMLPLALAALFWAPGLPLLGAAMLAPALVTLALALRLARKITPAAAPPSEAAAARNDETAPGAAADTRMPWAIGAGLVLSALYFRVDLFLIETWLGLEAVGLYNAVFRIVEALRLLPAAALAVAMPAMFTAAHRRPLVQISTWLTAGSLVITATIWLIADRLVVWCYGASFAAAAPALRVLSLSFPLMSLNYALTQQLIGWHGHRIWAVLCGVALVINVGVNAVMISAMGITGAAWTTLFTEVVMTIGCLIGLSLVSRPSGDSEPRYAMVAAS